MSHAHAGATLQFQHLLLQSGGHCAQIRASPDPRVRDGSEYPYCKATPVWTAPGPITEGGIALTNGSGQTHIKRMPGTQLIHLSAVDILIIAIYFALVLFIGFHVAE